MSQPGDRVSYFGLICKRAGFSYYLGVRPFLRPAVTSVRASVWDEPRPPDAPARVWRDWVLVAALVVGAVLEGALRTHLALRAPSVIFTVGLTPALLWRRTRPLLVVVIVFTACSLAVALTADQIPQMDTDVYLLIFPYALFRWGSGREAVIGAVVILAQGEVAAQFGPSRPTMTAQGAAVLVATMAVGVVFRYRAGARVRELDRVKLLERERLARDLHDTVAHHVSAIAIRAQAGLATTPLDPAANGTAAVSPAVDALRVIEAEASRTLAEMRSVVGVLRGSDRAQVTPGPSIADLAGLASADRAGPPVDVDLSGDFAGVPPPVAAAIYRLAQESVTNARRHARHATRIEVRVAADDDMVRLRVSDDGERASRRPARSRGYGLTGMIERARLLGGTCEAGPDPDRGWTVTAALPRAGSAA